MTIVWGSGASCLERPQLPVSFKPTVTALQVSYTGLQRASILQAQGLLLRPQCRGVERTDNRFAASCGKGCEHWSTPNHSSQFVGAAHTPFRPALETLRRCLVGEVRYFIVTDSVALLALCSCFCVQSPALVFRFFPHAFSRVAYAEYGGNHSVSFTPRYVHESVPRLLRPVLSAQIDSAFFDSDSDQEDAQ